MKARLVVFKPANFSERQPYYSVHAWPTSQPLPEGWEEIELTSPDPIVVQYHPGAARISPEYAKDLAERLTLVIHQVHGATAVGINITSIRDEIEAQSK